MKALSEKRFAGNSGRLFSLPVCTLLTWTCLLYGLSIRLGYYLSNQSLWHDEAAIALNIMNRGYWELLQPLDYDQAAPPLFLWLEKVFSQLFGPTEYALRLLPFLASLSALWMFYQMLQRGASSWGQPIAMGLFAASSYLVFFSGELKPYAVDVAVGLGLFLGLTALRGQEMSRRQQLQYGVLGSLAIWLSYPSVFMLAAAEAAHATALPWRRWGAILRNRLGVYAAWLLSFAGLYWGVIRTTLSNENLINSWGARYPDSPLDILWLLDAISRFFYRPLGYRGVTEAIAALAFLIGCMYLYRQRRALLALWMLPFGVTLAAGYLKQYPFRERLILFLVPFVIAVMAEGMAWSIQNRQRWIKGLGVVLMLTLVLGKAIDTGNKLLNPQETFLRADPIRPAMSYVQANWSDTDDLYIAPRAGLPVRYYARRSGFDSSRHVYGERPLPDVDGFSVEYFEQELSPFLDSSRVWLLFVSRSDAVPTPDAVLDGLNGFFNTSPTKVFRSGDTLACLYEPAR